LNPLPATAQRLMGVVRKRPGIAVCLCGEAGLGKSHVALELLRSTPCRNLSVRASLGLQEVIRTLPQAVGLPVWAERNLEKILTGQPVPNKAMIETTMAMLTAHAPFVLLIEDLHEINPATNSASNPETLEAWQGLAAAVLRSKGIGLIGTTRGLAPAGFETIKLEPKSLDETKLLMQSELGGTPPTEASVWIQARTLGNPLYVLEHARVLTRRGFLWSDGRRWRWRIPPNDLLPVTLEAMIEQEFQALMQTPDVRAVLEAFSLLESKGAVRAELLATVAAVDPSRLEQAMLVLESAAVLVVGPNSADLNDAGLKDTGLKVTDEVASGKTVSRKAISKMNVAQKTLSEKTLSEKMPSEKTSSHQFRHPLYREVMAQSLNPSRRQELETRAFGALCENDPIAATQFLEQAQVNNAQALELLTRAETIATAGHDAILKARIQALVVQYHTGAERGQIAFQAAMGLRRVSLSQAVPLAEIAVQDWPNPDTVYLLAELLATQGRMRDVERVLAALPASERARPIWPERLLKLKAGLRDFAGVLEVWQSQPQLQQHTDPEVACHVGWALLHANDTRAANELTERIEQEGLNPEQLADVKQIRAAIHLYDGDAQRAAAEHLESIQVFRQVGATEKLLYALRNHANALMLLGRYGEAKTELMAALEAANQRGDANEVCKTHVSLGALLTDLGEYETAEDLLLEALETLERMDPGLILNQCHDALFWLYRAWQPPLGRVLGVKHAEDALKLARALGFERLIAQSLAILGDAHARNANIKQAWPYLNDALELAEKLNEPERICIVQTLRGASFELAGQPQAAIVAYRTAQKLARSNGLLVEEHRAGLEHARLLNDAVEMREHLHWFEQHGLAVAAEYKNMLLEPTVVKLHTTESNRLESNIPEQSRPEQSKPEQAQDIRLDVLGSMRINNTQTTTVRGGKRQEFLALLLESRIAGRNEINKLEIFDRLYPDDDEERATSSLKSMVHSSRESLGLQVIVTTANGYALGEIASDVERFLTDHDTHWWRGDYLEGLEAHDQHNRDAIHAALLIATRKLLGSATENSVSEVQVSESNANEAVRTSRLLIRADPYNLDFLEIYLRSLQASGNRRSLSRAFAEAQERLLEVGEPLLGDWSSFLESRRFALHS
jgi:two-component SAPR family response regulator